MLYWMRVTRLLSFLCRCVGSYAAAFILQHTNTIGSHLWSTTVFLTSIHPSQDASAFVLIPPHPTLHPHLNLCIRHPHLNLCIRHPHLTPQVYAEATLVFPLLVAETFARGHHGLDTAIPGETGREGKVGEEEGCACAEK